MRRWSLALALLLALALPAASRAEETEAQGGAAPAAASEAEEKETAAPAEAAKEAADEPAATEAEKSAAEEPEAEASADEGEEPAAEASESEEPAAEESAEASEGESEEEDEGGFGASLLEYAGNTKTQFLTGLNGRVTGPADPVMATVEPPKAFAKATFERRPLGFFSGVLLMAYRSFTGAVDLVLAWGPLPVVSPVPRYKLIPGFEHEDE